MRRSDDVGFRFDLTGREAPVGEDLQRYLGFLTREPLGEEVTDRRRLLEAVTGETARAPEAREAVHRAQDRLMVWRHLVQARPCGLDSRGAEPWCPPVDHLGHGIEHSPVDIGAVARLFVPDAHSEQQAVALGME